MTTWRTIRFSLALVTVGVLATGLSGCGGTPTGMQEPAKVEPVKDKDGKTIYSLENESNSAPTPKAKK